MARTAIVIFTNWTIYCTPNPVSDTCDVILILKIDIITYHYTYSKHCVHFGSWKTPRYYPMILHTIFLESKKQKKIKCLIEPIFHDIKAKLAAWSKRKILDLKNVSLLKVISTQFCFSILSLPYLPYFLK